MHHEAADNYKNSSRYDRKNQPDGAAKNKNPPKSNDGDASELVLRLGNNDLLHTGSPIRRMICQTARHRGCEFQ